VGVGAQVTRGVPELPRVGGGKAVVARDGLRAVLSREAEAEAVEICGNPGATRSRKAGAIILT
jgi:hypothetical protein